MNEWFQTTLGQSVLQSEIERCARIIPAGYYPDSLQVGFPWLDFLPGLENRNKFVVDVYPGERSPDMYPGHGLRVVSRASQLPFPEKSMDLVVLPHTLDFCRNPHGVLQQVNQILAPEGCILIVGFNVNSLYGAIRLFRSGRKELPWCGKYYSVARVQDWLSLLGYDVVGAGMMNYQPPLHSVSWRERLAFMDLAGDRWFPGFGGMYAIVGKKREIGITPKPAQVRTWRKLIPGIAQPASQRAARLGIRLVKE